MKFEARKMLKVYIEDGDFLKLTELAKGSGKVVSEYVRDLILENLAEAEAGAVEVKPVPPPVKVTSVSKREVATNDGYFGKPAYMEHSKSCQCGVCNFAREAGLK